MSQAHNKPAREFPSSGEAATHRYKNVGCAASHAPPIATTATGRDRARSPSASGPPVQNDFRRVDRLRMSGSSTSGAAEVCLRKASQSSSTDTPTAVTGLPPRPGGGGVHPHAAHEGQQPDVEQPPPVIVTALYDYTAAQDDELTIRRGSRIQVLSKDSEVSGGSGWWTGVIDGSDRVGVFWSAFVSEDSATITPSNSQSGAGAQAGEGIPGSPLRIPYSAIELIDIIGSGGFGKVYKARWGQKTVAVKKAIISTRKPQTELQDSVLQEGRLFGMLDHPNIVRLVGVTLEYPNLCLVLEYCSGGSLNMTLSNRKIPPEILLDWARQIACGMYYLHEESTVKIIHRDLKSNNVLIQEAIEENGSLDNKTLKITDFGLAREAVSETRRSNQAGTFAWMAPESIKDSIFTKESDVWSYGVLLWELLTGEVPYKGYDFCAVAFGVANKTLHLHIPASCPEEFQNLLRSCWQANRKERPSFTTILEELRNVRETALLLSDDTFHTMQEDWRIEIEKILEEMKEKEKEICAREQRVEEEEKKIEAQKRDFMEQQNMFNEQLKRQQLDAQAYILEQLEVINEQAQKKNEEIKQREMSVLQRELQFALGPPNANGGSEQQGGSSQVPHPPLQPQPSQRMGKLRKSKLKLKPLDISNPTTCSVVVV